MTPELAAECEAIGFEAPPIPLRIRLRAGEAALGPREVATYRKVRTKMESRLTKAIADERYRGLDPTRRRFFIESRYALADSDARRRVIPALARRAKGAAYAS